MYRWVFDPPGYESVLDDLSGDARDALFAVLDALMFDPVDYMRTPREPAGKALRTIWFGNGRGMLTFVVNEEERLVLVVQVAWF